MEYYIVNVLKSLQTFDSIDTKLIEEWKSHRCIKFFRRNGSKDDDEDSNSFSRFDRSEHFTTALYPPQSQKKSS